MTETVASDAGGFLTRLSEAASGDAALREDALRHLAETSPLYAGRASGEADRVRGYLLARLGDLGWSDDADDYIREELELGNNPYCVAAAAHALQGTSRCPEWARDALKVAVERSLTRDDVIEFSPAPSGRAPATTVMRELFLAIGTLGAVGSSLLPELRTIASTRALHTQARAALDTAIAAIEAADEAPCCHSPRSACSDEAAQGGVVPGIGALEFEDQYERKASFSELFDRSANLIAFFYTRCMNPAKCSSTIEKLARLPARLGPITGDCRIAAITYDPEHDTARRMREYGANRGIGEDSPVLLLRPLAGLAPVMRHFSLEVGFASGTVSRHRSEAFLLDATLRINRRFLRHDVDLTHLADAVTSEVPHTGNGVQFL